MNHLILTPFRRGILWAALLALSAVVGSAQSAAISFQGQLADGNVPATGRYDFVFRLFGAATGGAEVAPTVLTADLAVTNGHFSVALDFGVAAYAGGPPRWVQVEVRTASTADAYSALLPRTALTPVPFALYALTAGQVSSTNLPLNLVYAAELLATNSALLTAFAADLLTTSNGVSARLLATNTALVSALASEGLLRTNGQAVLATDLATVTNGLSARLLATNSALLTALATDLLGTSNALSARLLGTNTALAASVVALQAQWLTGSNVVSGSNYFSGPLVATNATLTGSFTGNGAGLTNVGAGGLAGVLTSGQLPASVVYSLELQATNALLQSTFTLNLLSVSNGFASRLVATNTALVAGAVLGTNADAAMVTIIAALQNQLLSSNNNYSGSNRFSGPVTLVGTNRLTGSVLAQPLDETVVPLRIGNYFDTNRSGLTVGNIVNNSFTTTNLFEIQTGLISNTLSVDAAGRLSLGREGRPANALLQLSGDAAKRVGYDQTYVHYEPALVNPERTAGWSFRGGHGENYTDVRKNKYWTWGFNNREGAEHRTNEPSLFLNMETWWEPWPGAGEQDHQIELYWQFSNVGNTFGIRPWAMLLRGSNFLQHDIKVDDFSVGNADGTKPNIFQLETFRTPVNAGRINFTGQIHVKSSSIGGGIMLQDTTLQLSNQDKGQVAVMGWTGTDFALNGMNSTAPGSAFRLWGFTNVTVVPRAQNHVSLTISGVTGHATNLVEFRNQGNPALLASVSSNGVVNAAGFSAAGNAGITTNVALLAPGGGTNTLVFRNGILVEVR